MNKRVWIALVLCVAACSSPPPKEPAPLRNLVAALQAADVLYRKGDYTAAEDIYRQVLTIDPESIEANNRLGVLAHRQGQYSRAEQYFNQVLLTDPRNSTATYNLAVLHVEQAHELFKRYLAVSSTKAAERPAVFELQRAMQTFREQ